MATETTFGTVKVFDGLPIHQRVTILDDNGIKNMPEAPIVLIPQLNSGKYIVPFLATFALEIDEFNGDTYSNINEAASLSAVDSLSGDLLGYIPEATESLSLFLGGTVKSRIIFTPLNFTSDVDWGLVPYAYDFENIGGSLNLVFDNADSGPLETGFSTNTLRINTIYYIYDRSSGLYI